VLARIEPGRPAKLSYPDDEDELEEYQPDYLPWRRTFLPDAARAGQRRAEPDLLRPSSSGVSACRANLQPSGQTRRPPPRRRPAGAPRDPHRIRVNTTGHASKTLARARRRARHEGDGQAVRGSQAGGAIAAAIGDSSAAKQALDEAQDKALRAAGLVDAR